jgi:hydrogenase-4 component F
MLFLVAGNILAVYQSKSTTDVSGILRVLPASGVLWIAGFFAITGSPPFGPFLSEFTILKAALDHGRGGVAAAYLALLAMIFVGMITVGLGMTQGAAADRWRLARPAESVLAIGPPTVLAALVLMLGLYVPPLLQRTIEEAAHLLG